MNITRRSSRSNIARLAFTALPLALALLVAACSGGSTDATVVASAATARPSTPEPVVVTATPTAPLTATATPAPPPAPTPTPRPAATATPAPPVTPTGPPATGRWIDVDVTRFVVRLMDGKSVLKEIGPVAVGEQVDTGVYASTQTGLFRVYNKAADLTYDAPYNTYIAWWVGFDPAKDNGFHSFLLDAKGKVVDAKTGRVSNGCIRTGDPETIFNFAEVGMPVFVHA